MAIHPSQPWLAAACTATEEDTGAILVFDTQSGRLRAVTPTEGFVGWSDPRLLRWHPDGRRLATNVDTNGIALLDRGAWVGRAFPDDTRDSGVGYVWVGERLFADTGAFFEITPGDDQFEFDELAAPRFQAIEWNASAGVVVGTVGTGVAAYDPVAEREVYRETLDAYGHSGTLSWSPDGRWFVRRKFATPPAADELLFICGDTGKVHGVRQPSSPRIDELAWGPRGALAVSSYVHNLATGGRSGRKVDIFRAGELALSIDLASRSIQGSHSIAEASGIAWSPRGDGLALLLDQQEIRIIDAHSGVSLSTFAAPAPPIPDGLPDYYGKRHRPGFGFPGDLVWVDDQRLVRIAPHFVTVWSMDGEKIAEFVVEG
ncbi:PD40 domain-containing protein [Enhygromyxa salina]|uniref:PD40 domain-containing protein n=1 Tax=Enhygromyxa salina TaxID=215803 RepID=UPI0015E77DE5|nr:PD40 domain-containing protein [Enhygromyxa salina]